MPVIAGTGSNATAEAIEFTATPSRRRRRRAASTGYYNKPTQDGLYRHFKAINDAVDLPIVVYNVPVRSMVDMSVRTMARCSQLKNVMGVKDATANVARASQQRLAMGPDFNLLSGEDATGSASWPMADTAASR